MARAVLAEIDLWFETRIFQPLEQNGDARAAIAAMFDEVSVYFRSGRRVCLVGVLALGHVRDRFAETVQGYFTRWCQALATALHRSGCELARAILLAEEIVAGIQGAIVLARALDDPGVFARCIARLRALAV